MRYKIVRKYLDTDVERVVAVGLKKSHCEKVIEDSNYIGNELGWMDRMEEDPIESKSEDSIDEKLI